MESLLVVPISQVAAQQRAGRAGRTGVCVCVRARVYECMHVCVYVHVYVCVCVCVCVCMCVC